MHLPATVRRVRQRNLETADRCASPVCFSGATPGTTGYVRARHRARLAALRCRSSRARRDRSGCAAAHPDGHPSSLGRRPDEGRPGARPGGRLPRRRVDPAGPRRERDDGAGSPARWLPPLVRQMLVLYPRAPADRPRELATNLASRPAAAKALRAGPVVQPVVATQMLTNRWRLPVLDDLADVAVVPRTSAPPSSTGSPTRATSRARPPTSPSSTTASATGWRPAARSASSRRPSRGSRPSSAACSTRSPPLIPPHDAARGFRPGGSVRSYAAPHADRSVVLRLDLEAFFASVTVSRVYGIWRTAGYPESVAHCLAGLVTSVLPLSPGAPSPTPADDGLLDAHWRLGRRLAAPHLPQGAPTSPGDGQPGGLPARRAPHRAGPVVGRALHEVRRRPGVLRRARAGAPARRA